MDTINYVKNIGQYIGEGMELPLNRQDTVVSLFESQVRKTPQQVAIRYKNQTLTFEKLNSLTNQMANYLESLSLSSGSCVAIYLNPGIEMIVSILAALKTGCHYVPLDSNYPIDRINFMIKDSNSKFLITNKNAKNKFSTQDLQIINIDLASSNINNQQATYESKAKSDDLAYMIYTSGSTGVPKGVKICHFAINNHMTWMQHQFKFDNSDKILFKTPFSFDPSVWEILMPLFNGCELIIAPAGTHIDPDSLIDLIQEFEITTIQLVPSILKQLLTKKRIEQCSSLKKIFAGGESLRPEIKALFFEKLDCQLINLYGPTEATIEITFHEVLPSDILLNNIGKPIANTHIYLINNNRNLATIDEEGEIYVGSFSLSNGYHNREVLTQENFVANPLEPKKFKTLYKTGDLARWLPDGSLEYLGRNNDQVKINGVRIEPKELILTILLHESVSDCIIIKKTDTHGHDYLACYLTHKTNIELDTAEIKEHLSTKFPAFMLPKVYIPIDKIPLTVNGKVDKEALPKPDFKKTVEIDVSEGDLLENEYDLLVIWQLVLEVNQIGLHDNFFDSGGGSLLALKLLTLIHEKFDVSMRIRDIFEYPTVKLQAEQIKKLQESNKNPISPKNTIPNPIICLQPKGLKTPLFLIHPIGGTVFWFSHLAKLLGTARPVYGIQDPGVDLQKPVLNSIEEMAAFYLKQIKKIQPKGPYLIGGASFGATIAAEMSRQINDSQDDLSAIIVLDGWGVYPNTLLDDNYFKNSMLRQHDELISDFKKYGLPPPEILFDIQWFRLGLLWKYHLDLITHPIALFKSKEIMPAFLEIDAPFNHWEDFASNELKTIEVPGTHETMFKEPHVFELSVAINDYLSSKNI